MHMALVVLAAAVAGALFEALILHFLLPMLQAAGAVRKNYRGAEIPVSGGISFPLTVMLVFIGYKLADQYSQSYHLFIFALVIICLFGFVDDMLGQRDTLGFKGHLGALWHGRLTTGGLKAVGGGLVGLFLALFVSPSWVDIILNTVLIALFTNMINLFDLRPGRAVKGFLLFMIIIMVLAGAKVDYLLTAPLLGAVVVFFIYDLKAVVMMGDAGSNILGLSLGYISILSLDMTYRIGILLFLIGMHLYTEKYSLTHTIEQIPFLKAIDDWGRSRVDDK